MSDNDNHHLGIKAQLVLANGLALSEEQITVHHYSGKADLATLSVIDRYYSHQEALPDYADDSFMAFILSKPSVVNGQVSIHVYQPEDLPAQLWMKLKSSQGLAEVFAGEGLPVDVQSIQQALLLPADVAYAVEPKTLGDGPEWVKAPITVERSADLIKLSLPVMQTPLDVDARFAGHCYIKLLLAI